MIANFPAMDIRPGSMGRPLPGIVAAIVRRLDEDQVAVLGEPGVEGELALRPGWPSMFRAYLHDEERYRKCFVGGIHGGAEGNTVRLIDEMIAYFETTPGAVLPGITILLIPNANPDGYQLGQTAVGRFNANGVDLNRNWACDWTQAAYFRDQPVNPGVAPFSEPETLALGALINEVRPSAVLFYHSAANGAFAGDCDGDGSSAAMVAAFGAVTGYPYGQPFTDYVVTGTASNWVDSLGIPSADVELASDTLTEFERNLRGVITLQCWLIGANATGISACNQ
jgi:hypothetical protein